MDVKTPHLPISENAQPKVSAAESSRRTVERAIRLYLLVFAGITCFTWVFWLCGLRDLNHFPLGDLSQRFGDLIRFSGKDQIGRPAQMLDMEGLRGSLFPRNYTPFAAVVYVLLLQWCAPYSLLVMLAIELGAVLAMCWLLWRRVRGLEACRWYVWPAIFATALCGWGTLQVVMRGNIEGLVWIGVCSGAVLYARRNYAASATGFAMACCLKPQPVLWLALMALHRKYREAAFGLLVITLVTLVSLFLINPNPVRAWHIVYQDSSFFVNYIVSFRPMDEMKGDHSLLQSIKTIARIVRYRGMDFPWIEYMRTQPNNPLAWKLYRVGLPLSVIIGALAALKVWKMPMLNQIFALAAATTVLPMMAADYTLIVLLIPMGFFLVFLLEDVARGRVSMSLGAMLWFLLPCAWAMATEPLGVLHGVLKCAAVLTLLGASVMVPLPTTLFGDLAPHTRAD